MKSLALSLSAAALCAATLPSHAIPSPEAQLTTDASARLLRAEAQQLPRGIDQTYLLTNGRRLQVTTDGAVLRVRYGAHLVRHLRPDGNGSYVSQDGQLALRFEKAAAGDGLDVRWSMPASMQ